MTIPTKSPEDLLWTLNNIHPSTDEHSNHHYPGFVVFLGAGPSIEAGIPGAASLLLQALRERLAKKLSHASQNTVMTDAEIEAWAQQEGYFVQNNPESRYAQVMQHLFDTAASREQFVRRALRKARVSDGYRILGELIKRGVFDTILTTNFDFLVRQGADIVLPWPIDEVCSLEQYSRFKAFSTDPRVVRLHGDFWHGNLRNTEEELSKTPDVIYRVVTGLFRCYGAIIIGYSGEDSNVMQEMFPIRNWQDPDFLLNGIYWCDIKEPQDLAPKVKSFLAEGARVGRAFYVKIDGFTSLMRQIGESYGVTLSLEQDMEKDIKKYWEWMALLTDLADDVTRQADYQDFRQRHLESLVKLLAAHGAVCVSRNRDSRAWDVNVVPQQPFSIPDDDSINNSLRQLHNQSPDYQQTAVRDLPKDNVFYEFLKGGGQIESFPVWRGEQLLGLVSFASIGQSLSGDQRMRLIRSAIKLLVVI